MGASKTREKILKAGVKIVHHKGFAQTSIKDVLSVAGVPKGSFYHFFDSKESFGLSLVELFENFILQQLELFLKESEEAPLLRLRRFFYTFELFVEEKQFKGGCPLGLLAQETGENYPRLRERLEIAFKNMAQPVSDCLKEAWECGDLDEMDFEQTAHFILNSWQGALLKMKVAHSAQPLELFADVIFNQVLRQRKALSEATKQNKPKSPSKMPHIPIQNQY